jgi:hypothetical protein
MDAPSVPAAEGEPVPETLFGTLRERVTFQGDLVLPIGESVELSAEGCLFS